MFKSELLDRFLRYVKVDTMSDPRVAETQHPSTEGQWDLLKMLEKELKDMGIKDVSLDQYGYLLARIPANAADIPTIAFSSHVDTSSDVQGNGVQPCVIENYDGKSIELANGKIISVSENPDLAGYVGTTLIVSDGNTLLGSDDKSGVAEIMTAAHYLVKHPEIRHGEVEILFSPDEETGSGMDFFDAKKLNCKAFYTMDGGRRFEIEAECFNAASVEVIFNGVSYHLGSARGRMVNAVTMLSSFVSALPQAESPEATDGRYGYYCAHEVEGNSTKATLKLLLRDFDLENLLYRIKVLEDLADTIQLLYKGSVVEVNHKISYLNMIQPALKDPRAIDAVFAAGKELGQKLESKIIRGGTDGARIAQMLDIPCPNIYAGGHNMHSVYEWAALDAMNDATKLLLGIVKQWAK